MAKNAVARANNDITNIVDVTKRARVNNSNSKQRQALVTTVSEWYARGSAQQPCKFFVGGGLADGRGRKRRTSKQVGSDMK